MADQIPQSMFQIIHESMPLPVSFDVLRILFVLSGRIRVLLEQQQTIMNRSDILLINPMEEAEIFSDEEFLAAVIEIPFYDLLKEMNVPSARFFLDSTQGVTQEITETRYIIRGLLMCCTGDMDRDRFQIRGLYYMLLHKLAAVFSISSGQARKGSEREEKAREILELVWTNYRNEISLTEIADKLFLSRSTASRLFKQYAGEDFPVYLNNLRLKMVVQELQNTDHSISEIAYNCGFSSPAVLNRIFREKYGIAPGKYREDHPKQVPSSDKQDLEMVRKVLETEMKLNVPEDMAFQEISVPVSKGQAWNGWKERLLNVGPVHTLRSASLQNQILFLQQRLNIEYVRLWSPFSDSMLIIGDRKGEYSFTLLDEALDFCVDHRLKVFLDLTLRKDRQMASERREMYGVPVKEYFRELPDWLNALSALILHLRNRYHESTIRDWIFEMTFFLSDIPYYDARSYNEQLAWEKSCDVIRKIVPNCRIAGPGLIPDLNKEREKEFVLRFAGGPYAPDIFTSGHFPYFKKGIIDSSGFYEKNPNTGFFYQEVQTLRNMLDEAGYKGEFWAVEYGISLANRNYLQDSCYRGAAALSDILGALDMVDTVGAFYASDLQNAFSDTMAEISGGGGMLTKSGARKPIYYAYRFISQLGDHLITRTPCCTATAYHAGDIRILCWNRKHLGPKYYLMEEDSFKADDLDELMTDTDPLFLDLSLSGVDGDTCRIRQRILNGKRTSILKKWVDLGSIETLSRDDLDYLSQTAVPEVVSEIVEITDGNLRLRFRMEPNELRMIMIQKM